MIVDGVGDGEWWMVDFARCTNGECMTENHSAQKKRNIYVCVCVCVCVCVSTETKDDDDDDDDGDFLFSNFFAHAFDVRVLRAGGDDG